MRRIALLPLLATMSACGTINMPAPVAYSGACPHEDYKCQRNLDAQTLKYLGEDDAAVALMCEDIGLRAVMGSRCADLSLSPSELSLY